MNLRAAFESGNNRLDALRLLFALLVLVAHSWPLVYGEEKPDAPHPTTEPVLWLTLHQLFGGTLAVLFFFLLSGFLVTESFLRCPSVFEYLRRRILRIYPGYVVAILLTAFGFAWLCATRPGSWLAEFPWSKYLPRVVGLHMCVTPETFAKNPYPFQPNGSLWTVAHEFWCYILVAGLGLCGGLRRASVVWPLFVAAWVTWNLQMHLDGNLIPDIRLFVFGKAQGWPQLLTFFLAGVLVHRHARSIPLTPGLFLASLALLAIGVALGKLTVVLPFAATYALFWLAFAGTPWLLWKREHPDLSYGVYLYAWPIQQTLLALWPMAFVASPWWLSAAATPLALGIAWVSWRWIERPFLARKRKAAPAPIAASPLT